MAHNETGSAGTARGRKGAERETSRRKRLHSRNVFGSSTHRGTVRRSRSRRIKRWIFWLCLAGLAAVIGLAAWMATHPGSGGRDPPPKAPLKEGFIIPAH